MDETQSTARPESYVIKLWIEPPGKQEGARLARGMVTQVETGKRWYVKSFDEMVDFFTRQLARGGVRLGLFWRIWQKTRSLRASGQEQMMDAPPARPSDGLTDINTKNN